jgi:predicted aldo/keto reductase-like oxidoreductase
LEHSNSNRKLLEHHADECIEGGICMMNCPFGVDIIRKMKKADKLFGLG